MIQTLNINIYKIKKKKSFLNINLRQTFQKCIHIKDTLNCKSKLFKSGSIHATELNDSST